MASQEKPQIDAEQVGDELGMVSGHTLPTLPQFIGSLVVAVQPDPVSAYPSMHLYPHFLFEQVGFALAVAGQTLPTAPQLLMSSVTLVQYEPICAYPLEQAKEHLLLEQVAREFAGWGQTLYCLPQLLISLSVL